jgi:hypothetical protein
MLRTLLILAMLVGLVARAQAHSASTAYLEINREGPTLDITWEIALRDLDYAVGLDPAADGAVTWGGLKAKHAAIAEYAMNRLAISGDGAACPFGPSQLMADRHGDGGYAVLRFAATCPATPAQLAITYRLLFDLDPLHRGLLRLTSNDRVLAQVFSPTAPNLAFDVATDIGSTVREFFFTGVDHILTGYDHLMFITVLLIPAIFVRVGGRWTPYPRFRTAFIETVKTMSAFSLAHACTLTLAVLGVLHLAERLTESAIALTILLTAVDNIRPIFGGRRWMLGFAFGLIHGFGFASALGPLDLPPVSLGVALISFNMGIEAIQVSIVALVLPVAYLLRTRPGFPLRFVPAASACALAMAGLWFFDRALDLRMMPI